jgi:formin 2
VRARASVASTQLDKREMEALLCEDPKAQKKKKKVAAKKEAKAQKVSLLDAKRQQNIGIALSQFKCSLQDIRAAILKMDTGMLNTDKLLALQTMMPTGDELKTLHAYLKKNKNDDSQLGVAEKAAMMLASLPMVHDWLHAMLFREEFQLRQQEIADKLALALTCAVAVRSSEALKEVFALVLAIGNFINAGHMLGNAVAFTFASTALLIGNKLSNKRGTLLHLIVKALEKKGIYINMYVGFRMIYIYIYT